MKNNNIAIAFAILLSCLLSGCGGGGSSSLAGNACADLNLRVYGGAQCNYHRSPVVPIVAYNASSEIIGVCSATMVTVNDALTAAHCALLASIPGFAGAFVYADDEPHLISNFSIHPLYDGSTVSAHDIAMLTINDVLDIGPVPLLLSNPIATGERISVFGYGRNEDYYEHPHASDFKAAHMRIEGIGGGIFAASFDTAQAGICHGDSGGPVTQTIAGITSIVGVSSFGVSGCQSGSVSGFVDMQIPGNYEFVLNYAPDVAVR